MGMSGFPNLQAASWAIDGVGLIVATALLALQTVPVLAGTLQNEQSA
jgi:hypothetical protein